MKELLRHTRRGLFRRRPMVPDLSEFRPREALGRVVVSGLGPGGFGAGKSDPEFFLPPFAFELARSGIETVLATTMHDLLRACDTPLDLAIVHVYNEDFHAFDDLFEFDRQVAHALIFNRAELGDILGWKDKTHDLLTSRGIAMPRPAGELGDEVVVFSNARRGSGSPVSLLRRSDGLDRSRYNVEYIDTRRTYLGVEYYTTPRLMCVGREIVDGVVRASPVSAGSVAVRRKFTPLDPEMLTHFYDELIAARRAEMVDLAVRIGDALGPGFYAHDFLVDRESGEILLCESGFKLDLLDIRANWHAMAAHMPECDLIFSPVQAARSGQAFLSECHRHGWFARARQAARITAAPWGVAPDANGTGDKTGHALPDLEGQGA